jgi:dipeptidyl aminopeptidase/acylaminoacyl peptidase
MARAGIAPNLLTVLLTLATAAGVSANCAEPVQTAPPASPIELRIPARDAVLAATLRFPASGAPPYPAIVLAHGSGRTTRDQMRWMADRFLGLGLAVLTYDKRGVGESTGTYINVGTAQSIEVFGTLADDALAGLAAIRTRKDIDARRIGLGGMSQAGWIVPLAASKSREVAFLVILSGPAVTVGEEMEYSRLAGADPGSLQGISDAEIGRRMRAFEGPHGYDPVPVLDRLDTPSLWIEGEQDRSVPMAQTLATLERLRAAGRPITVIALPDLDHSLRHAATRESPNFWPRVGEWLAKLR